MNKFCLKLNPTFVGNVCNDLEYQNYKIKILI